MALPIPIYASASVTTSAPTSATYASTVGSESVADTWLIRFGSPTGTGYGDAIGNGTNDSASPPTGSISETTSTQSPETRSATPVPSTLARSNMRLKN